MSGLPPDTPPPLGLFAPRFSLRMIFSIMSAPAILSTSCLSTLALTPLMIPASLLDMVMQNGKI